MLVRDACVSTVLETFPLVAPNSSILVDVEGTLFVGYIDGWHTLVRPLVTSPEVAPIDWSLAKCIGTPHGVGVLEDIGVELSTGLTSEVGYPYLEIMVIAKVPIEVVLVAPIWGHCDIQSQVKIVITPIYPSDAILLFLRLKRGFFLDVSSSAMQGSGKVTVDSSRSLLGSILSISFVNFWMGFDEKPRGLLQLVRWYKSLPNWEMPPMALPLVDNSAKRAVSPFTMSLDSSLQAEFLSSLSWVSTVRRDASFRISFSRSWSALLTLTVCSA
eukprot:Gb_11762 [translate_table: standard]